MFVIKGKFLFSGSTPKRGRGGEGWVKAGPLRKNNFFEALKVSKKRMTTKIDGWAGLRP